MKPEVSPEVSIVIAAYNVERYIARAVHSALAQEGVRVEVIVVDDCSTDGTYAAVSSIQDARLTCIRQLRNAGPSAARNAGFGRASGEWIAVLDGDDALEPWRLERCLARAAGADIIVDNLTVLREADGASFPMFAPASFARHGTLDLAGFIAGNRSFLGGYGLGYLKPVFSAEFLRRHGLSYDEDIHIGEDYLLLAGALACGGACAVEHSAGYLYTARAGSISHRLTPEDVLRISARDEKFLSRHVLNPVAARAQRKREAGIKKAYAYALLVEAIKRKNPRGILRALRVSPAAAVNLWRPVWVRVGRMLA